jgi:hypothetical protein
VASGREIVGESTVFNIIITVFILQSFLPSSFAPCIIGFLMDVYCRATHSEVGVIALNDLYEEVHYTIEQSAGSATERPVCKGKNLK